MAFSKLILRIVDLSLSTATYHSAVSMRKRKLNVVSTREPLLKGKAQYSWPPCIKWLSSAAFI